MTTSTSLISTAPSLIAPPSVQHENAIIEQSLAILDRRLFSRGQSIQSVDDVGKYLRLKMAALDHEAFGTVFLDAGHRVLNFEVLFHGSIHEARVYPGEVMKRVITHNAAAVILAHNNPSGRCRPSDADRAVTRALIDLLRVVDVRVLDHLIVGEGQPFSFAEAGLL